MPITQQCHLTSFVAIPTLPLARTSARLSPGKEMEETKCWFSIEVLADGPVYRSSRSLRHLYLLGHYQRRAWHDFRISVLLAVGKKLPAELAEMVVEWTLLAEGIPVNPRVHVKVSDGGEERGAGGDEQEEESEGETDSEEGEQSWAMANGNRWKGFLRPLPCYMCGSLIHSFDEDVEAAHRMTAFQRMEAIQRMDRRVTELNAVGGYRIYLFEGDARLTGKEGRP